VWVGSANRYDCWIGGKVEMDRITMLEGVEFLTPSYEATYLGGKGAGCLWPSTMSYQEGACSSPTIHKKLCKKIRLGGESWSPYRMPSYIWINTRLPKSGSTPRAYPIIEVRLYLSVRIGACNNYGFLCILTRAFMSLQSKA